MTARSKLRVAVICGGNSKEAGVSRISGGAVATGLRTRFDKVAVMELNRHLVPRLLRWQPDVVFPVLHGAPGEDGTLQGCLETLGIAYVGSRVLASACALNKRVARVLFQAAGLPVAPGVTVTRGHGKETGALHVAENIGCDVVIKPVSGGSALHVRFANDLDSVRSCLGEALAEELEVLVERRIRGDEITVGVLERNGYEALPAIKIETPAGSWYDYTHRYTPGLSHHRVPAPIAPHHLLQVQEFAVRAHRALGCRHLSRADFIVPAGGGTPVLLEVNSMPGMTPTSLYPDAAAAAGIDFDDLVAGLVHKAGAQRGVVRDAVFYHLGDRRQPGQCWDRARKPDRRLSASANPTMDQGYGA